MLLWLYSEPATMSRVSLTEMIGLWQWVRGQSRIRYRMTVATAMWVEQPDRINTFESPLIPYTLWYCWNWKGFLPVAQRAIKSSSSRFIAAFTSTLNFENLLVALIKLIRGRGCISSSQTAPSTPPLPHFASWLVTSMMWVRSARLKVLGHNPGPIRTLMMIMMMMTTMRLVRFL